MKKERRQQSVDLSSCACSGVNLPKLVQPSIMATLLKGPIHGYALAQQISRESQHLNAPPDHSGIYRLLRGMENRGLVTSSIAVTGAGPARREYELTDLGRICLKRWMEALSRYREMIDAVLRLGGK